jgi:predicted MFS family arabinose efflux permease
MRARRAWVLLVGAFLVSVGYNAFTIAPAPVLPLLAGEFGVDKPTAGLAISAVYVSWVLLQIPGGLLMDRRDNRLLVVAGAFAYFVAAAGAYLAPTYPLFLLARALGGASAVFIWTASTNVVARSLPASRRALGTSFFVASASAGFALGQFFGPRIAAAFGWRAVFLVYPLVTLVGLPVFALAANEPVRNEATLSVRDFARSLRDPAVIAVSVAAFCSYSLFLFFNSWMPVYATEVLGLDLSAAGAVVALVPLSGLLARPGGGWLSDRLGGRRRPVVVASFVLSIPVLLVLAFAGRPGLFATLLLVAGFAAQLSIGVYYVYVGELARDGRAGTSLAVLSTCAVAGSLTAPVLTGWLVETTTWTVAFGYALVLGGAGIVLAMRAPRT